MKELEVSIQMVPGNFDTTIFDELKEYSDQVASLYDENIVVTEDNANEVKKDLSYLRKLNDTLEEDRKARHSEYEKPYEDWLVLYKSAKKPITDTIDSIEKKLKAYNDTEEKKRISTIDAEILKDADDIRKGLAETVKSNPVLWSIVCKPTYYNKSPSKIKITEEWRTALTNISRDFDFIKTNPDSDQLLVAYMNCGNLSMAMQEVADNKRKIAVLNQQKAAAEERKNIEATTPIVDIVDITPQTFEFKLPNESVVDPEEMKTVKSTRMFVGELYKIKALYKFALSIGINIYTPNKEK